MWYRNSYDTIQVSGKKNPNTGGILGARFCMGAQMRTDSPSYKILTPLVLYAGDLYIGAAYVLKREDGHVPGILNPNTGGKNLYGELSVHIRKPILNPDSNVWVQYAWDVYHNSNCHLLPIGPCLLLAPNRISAESPV